MINPAQFIAQVRAEAAKVVWPSRKEAGITTLMVLLMAVLASVFFVIVDFVLRQAVDTILGF
jgi:preprotein translocase subunit SecE